VAGSGAAARGEEVGGEGERADGGYGSERD